MTVDTGGTVELVGLRKVHGDAVAVDGIDLTVRSGEFFSLLGPSGCGKTSTLRMIAGLDPPTSGRIMLDGVDQVGTPAHRRPVNTVFQSYALFPHMSVRDNVGYGLRWRPGLDRAQRRRRVDDALKLVRLTRLADRPPDQLSGGEQQRVALARALVCEPAVLLLDEPFGALDAKLRKVLRTELTQLQRAVGTTFIFVTHDQEEALEMSDRLAVMDAGRVIQCGSPRDLYEAPRTEFVADFLGAANLLEVTCLAPAESDRAPVRLGEVALTAACSGPVTPGPGLAVIRPERVRIGPAGPADAGANAVPAVVDGRTYVGATTLVTARLRHGPEIKALVVNDAQRDDLGPGAAVSLILPVDALRLLARDAGLESGAGLARDAGVGEGEAVARKP
jgi:spermidine/putrescine transport system ATP-binding protein